MESKLYELIPSLIYNQTYEVFKRLKNYTSICWRKLRISRINAVKMVKSYEIGLLYIARVLVCICVIDEFVEIEIKSDILIIPGMDILD